MATTPRQSARGGPDLEKPHQDTVVDFENLYLEGRLTFGDPFHDSGVAPGHTADFKGIEVL